MLYSKLLQINGAIIILACVSTVCSVVGLSVPHCALSAEICSLPHFKTVPGGFRYDFPPVIKKKGLVFAQKRIPIQRSDVRERILNEINYWLLDRRSRVLRVLLDSDHLGSVIPPILKKYNLPPEFLYLAAVESMYNSRALSPAGAFGYWQFIESTAKKGPSGCPIYNWKMEINKWKDERADLICSTHSAARYLAWMNRIMMVRLKGTKERKGFRNWILTAAAYNSGPSRVVKQLSNFEVRSYWDVPLPTETEKYVPRWIALALISKYRKYYGVEVPFKKQLFFDAVRNIKLKKDLPFAAIAKLINTSPRRIWTLNSQIPSHQAVFPAKSRGKVLTHLIKVPRGKGKILRDQLKSKGYLRK